MGQISTFYPNPGPSQAEKFCKEEIRMRNLKRALSLTLASVMLLGMMVIGTSAVAGYSDVDVNDNVEAIEVLQAVEVMVGDDRGFGPDRPVTRAEMAVVMGKLLNLDYNYYVSTCPFADVSGNFDWAKGWVGACAANGIVSGRGDGIYDPAATVTAVEAASMMMRALGYFRYQNDYADGFMVSTVRLGTKIGIFEGVGTDAATPMTRNQVAQMALNALRSGMVEPDGNTINLTTPDGSVFTGKVNYVFVTSAKPYATAISSVQATAVGSQNGGTIVELGEQLYNGNLELNDDARDDFGRPAREWKFKGNEIGTYVKKELIRKEWTTEVTGKDLYDEITKSVLDDKNYDKNVYIDGQDDSDVNEQLFELTATALRNNKDGVGATGNGVLTQLFIDPKSGNDRDQKDVTVAIINTYLAKAKADYSEKKDEVDFNVYGIKETTVKNEFMKLVDARKNTDDDKETLTVTGDDFAIEDIKKDDTFLVTVADGAIQTIEEPEVIAKATMTAFKKDSNVVVEGTKYDYSDTAEWNYKVLDRYTGSGRENLKDKSYDVYLDKYGYAIGVDLVASADNYIFITGVDDALSNRYAKNIEASGIFLDGTMKEITYNAGDSDDILAGVTNYGLVNTWCSYTVNKDGIYTLKQIANKIDADNGDDVAQSHDTALAGDDDGNAASENSAETINKKNIDMVGGSGEGDYKKVYGNDNTVYLNVSVKTINVDKPSDTTWHGIIADVDSVITGIDNVSLDMRTVANAKAEADSNGKVTGVHPCSAVAYGAYALYNDDGYIIAAVTVADDGSTSDNWVYVTSGGVTRESYDGEADQWTWSREVALDGVATEITYKGDALKHLDTMKKYNWYEVKYKGDGNVKSVTLAVDALSHGTEHSAAQADAKYEGNINNLENAVQNGKDTILYEASSYQSTDGSTNHNHTGYGAFIDEEGQPYLKNGKTFYVNTTTTTGFRIKDDTKVVFIQTNKQKETIEYYEGPDKLEDVVEDLNKGTDGNYDYEISAILDGNVARVVVVRDLNKDNGSNIDTSGGGDAPSGSSGVDVNVIAVLDFDGSTAADEEVFFVATGSDKVSTSIKCEAIEKVYADTYGEKLADVEVKYEEGTTGVMWFNVYVKGTRVDRYQEADVAKLVAVPTAKKVWETAFPSGTPTKETDPSDPSTASNTQLLSEAALLNGSYGDFVSWDAEFTPTVDESDGSITLDITGIKWITDLNSKVPFFYYDRDVAASSNNYTIKQAYLSGSSCPAVTDGMTDISSKNIKSFAIIPMVSAQDGRNIINIYFKDADGNIYRQTGVQITGTGSTAWTSSSGHYGPSGTTVTIIPH